MKILNVYPSAPDTVTQQLVAIVAEGRESASFNLYDAAPDYDKLVDMIFEADQTITWW